MNQKTTWKVTVAVCMTLLTTTLASASTESERSDAAASTECCYKNSRHAGVCVVQPAEGETCDSILDYLNNPSSSGKSYCGFTEIRGGWEETPCPDEKVTSGPSVSRQIPDRVRAGPLQDSLSDPNNEEAY